MRVQVIGYKGRGRGSKLIMWFTRGRVSHLSLRFKGIEKDVRDIIFDKFAVRVTSDHEIESIQGRGVIHHSFELQDNQIVFNFKQDGEQSWLILRSAIKLIGKKYDWRGIWGFLSRRKRHNPDKWFCSELVAFCLLRAGIVLLWTPPYQQTPNATVSSTVLLEE